MPLAELRVLSGIASIKPSITDALRLKFAASNLILSFARAESGFRVEIAVDRRYSVLSTCWSLSTTSDSREDVPFDENPTEPRAIIGSGESIENIDLLSNMVRESDCMRSSNSRPPVRASSLRIRSA